MAFFAVCISQKTQKGLIYLFADLEMVVPVVDKCGKVVAKSKAVQPEVKDGGVHHLKCYENIIIWRYENIIVWKCENIII